MVRPSVRRYVDDTNRSSPDSLNQSDVFIGATASFQNRVAVILMTVGVGTVPIWVPSRRHGFAVAVLLGAASLDRVIVVRIRWIPQIPSNFTAVNASTARQLTTDKDQRHIPRMTRSPYRPE